MSPSEVHAAAKRSLAVRLAVKEGNRILPNIRNIGDFLLHGIQYVFSPERGELNRGMPTDETSQARVSIILKTIEELTEIIRAHQK